MSSPGIDKSTPLADKATLDAVRPLVREMLLNAPAFAKLSPDEQQQIAGKMVQVAAYMANPDGVLTQSGAAAPLARAQAEDPTVATRRRLSQAPGQVGKEFEAGATKQGVE